LVGWLENVGTRDGDRKKQSDESRGGDRKNKAMRVGVEIGKTE
jgi:hypothetical protein